MPQWPMRIALAAALLLGAAACGDDGGGGGNRTPDDAGVDTDLDATTDPASDPLARVDRGNGEVEPTPVTRGCLASQLQCVSNRGNMVGCWRRGNVVTVQWDSGKAGRFVEISPERLVFSILDGADACAAGAFPGASIRDQAGPTDEDVAPEFAESWDFFAVEGTGTIELGTEEAAVVCPDGTADLHRTADVRPLLEMLPEDFSACEEVDAVECTSDFGCDSGSCCAVADLAACVEGCAGDLSRFSAPVGGCLHDMLSCFGPGTVDLGCSLAPSGTATIDYLGGRSARVRRSGDQWSIEAMRDGEPCFSAQLTGDVGSWTSASLLGPDGVAADVSFDRSRAVVDCATGTSTADVASVLAFLPRLVDPDGPRCQPFCNGDTDCSGGRCCPNMSGGQSCIDASSCPDTVQMSCLGSALSCFGRDAELQTCSAADWPALRFIEASYDADRSGQFFDLGQQSRLTTSRNGADCYTVAPGIDGTVVIHDVLRDAMYTVSLGPDEVAVSCPGGQMQTVLRSDFDAWVPSEPDLLECTQAERPMDCAVASDCPSGTICCDHGSFTTCRPQSACLPPTTACSNSADCGDDASCCPTASAWICDPDLCGDELCCLANDLSVCTEGESCP